jgi:predicted phage tail protein
MKDERTESVFVYVTPQVKREFDMAKDNKTLQDNIIRNHFQSETDWLKQEMQEMDEVTLKYRAKLLNIKDNFAEAQEGYVEQIGEIINVASSTFSKLDAVGKNLHNKVEESSKLVKNLAEQIQYINVDRLDRLLDSVEKFERMTTEQKKLIEMLIADKN